MDNFREYTEKAREIIEKEPSWVAWWGNITIAIFLLIIALSSYFIKYPDIIDGQAEVISTSDIVDVRARTTSSIAEVLHSKGDTVSVKDWVMTLKSTANPKDIRDLKALLANWDIKKIQQINLKNNWVLGECQTSYNRFVSSVSTYKNFMEAEVDLQKLTANNQLLTEHRKMIAVHKKNEELLNEEESLKKEELQRYEKLFDKKIISKDEFEKKKLEYIQIKGKSTSHLLENLAGMNNIYSIEKDNQVISREIWEKRKGYQANIEIELLGLLSEIDMWEEKYALKSTISGIIDTYNLTLKNRNIENGELVFSVIPFGKRKNYCMLYCPVAGIGKVKKGQKVIIRLSDYPSEEFGSLQGRVENISQVRKNDLYHIVVTLENEMNTNRGFNISGEKLLGVGEIITRDLSLLERVINALIKKIEI